MSAPSRFTSGVSTVPSSDLLGQFPEPDPTQVISYFNDFHVYAAGDWTVTGSPTNALVDVRGGALQMTAANTTNDTLSQIQLSKEGFVIQSGKKAWFKARVKMAAASAGDMVVGLYVADTSPVASAPSDGIYFRKDDGDANIDFTVNVDSAAAVSTTAIGTLVADTFVTLGFYYDGVTTVRAYVDDIHVATLTLTAANLAALDDETLAPAFAQQNANGGAATVGTIDYLLCAVER